FPAEARYWHQLGHTRIFFWEYMAGRDLKSQATKEYRLAIKAFEEAVRLAPDDAQFLNNLAWYLATSDDPTVRDPARAVELARRAVTLEQDHWSKWDTLGVACYRAGSWSEAVSALEKRLAIQHESGLRAANHTAAAEFYLAMAYRR